jgi:ribonuclease Z
MKPSFLAKRINKPFEDPGLYVRILREGRALMFDLGFTANLSARDILKTSDIFVSHTHVDHFIGFDNVLRTCLRRDTPLRLYGPKDLADSIEGKLRGYTWNLIEDYPLMLEVFSVDSTNIRKSVFRADKSFAREDISTDPFDRILFRDSSLKVSTAILNHQVPCLAFSMEEDFHINIDKARLSKLNLSVGPWLGDLKSAIRKNKCDTEFSIDGAKYSFIELRDIARITTGQKISYVVDAVGSEENIEKIVDLVRKSDVLYIETYFSDKEKDRALQRYHLTAREAGMIARLADVKRVEPVHCSPRYIDSYQKILDEISKEFGK